MHGYEEGSVFLTVPCTPCFPAKGFILTALLFPTENGQDFRLPRSNTEPTINDSASRAEIF